MKVFTQVGQKDLDQVKPENINDNTRMVVGEYNGKLDGQNFPVATIDKLKMAPPTLTSQSTAKLYGFKHIGQTQDHHFVRRWNTYEGSVNIHYPLVSFDLQAESWSSGWNDLVDIHADYAGLILEFDAKSGSLNGCFDINFRHGIDVITNSGGSDVAWSKDWWSRWGLFCNDILIAETGRVYPRLANLSVPYKIFVGSQPVRLQLKWQTITTNPKDELGVDTHPVSVMEIYGASIWACNTKR
tara:strand:+ start:4220 stop:4945 length:726 start_codon:yes stop_codon:yes gene_type:complete